MSEEFDVIYEYNNIMYNIRGTKDFHETLQTDFQFQQNYFKEHSYCSEVVGVGTSTTEPIPMTESTLESSDREFVWTKSNTLLLLNCVLVRKDMFRSVKQKNRNLWNDIQKEFKSKNYIVTVEQLDRKLRNLKKTYKTIKDKNNRTGGGRITWDFYKEMEEIYGDDQSVNPGEAITSFVDRDNGQKLRSVTETTTETIEIQNLSDPSSTAFGLGSTVLKENENKTAISLTDNQSKTTGKTEKTKTGKENVSRIQKGKDLREYRRQLLQIEKDRIAELRNLRLHIEESNRIQKERNNILRHIANKPKK